MSKIKLRKLPWGIFAGVLGMIVFFSTIALVVTFIVDSGVAGQTSESVTLFEAGYRVVLFVVDVIAAVGFIGSLALWILRVTGKLGKDEEVKDEDI